ncbi:MAG: porin OmpA [Candidatus Dasytiphilus stammeri]
MKKQLAITFTVVALAVYSGIASSAVPENTWYTGPRLGWSQYSNPGYHGNGYIKNDGPTYKNPPAFSSIFGYQVTPNVGLELGYDWLGRMQNQGKLIKGYFKAYGIELTTKLNYPITDKFDIYTRVGGMIWRADSSQDNPVWGHIHDYQNGLTPLGAIGVEYALSKKIVTRLDYQVVNKLGDLHTVGTNPDNSILSLGITYYLNHNVVEPELPISSTYEKMIRPELDNKHLSINSDILFKFDKFDLTTAGKQQLNELYYNIKAFDYKNSSTIRIVGYSDRIGSGEYNQILSEKRAQSVANYLIAKGIDSDKIYIQGKGTLNSITGKNCDFIHHHSSILIRCLAPDRRVEIEVNGIKNINITKLDI